MHYDICIKGKQFFYAFRDFKQQQHHALPLSKHSNQVYILSKFGRCQLFDIILLCYLLYPIGPSYKKIHQSIFHKKGVLLTASDCVFLEYQILQLQ